MSDIQKMADAVFAAVEGYLAKAAAGFDARFAELEKRIADIPAGKDGTNGADGKDGANGFAGKDADEDAIVKRVLEAIPAPKNGKDGANGKDADEEVIVASVLASIPRPENGKDGVNGKDGENGKDADEQSIVAKVLASIPVPKDGVNGKDGESIHQDSIALMIRESVDKAFSNVRLPQDGAPGRDAIDCEILERIDEARSYPIGTYAKYRGGTIRAMKHTEPLSQGFDGSGWTVVSDGVAEIKIDWPTERTAEITVVKTSGERVVSQQYWAIPLDRGVFKGDREYEPGDGVTWGGSFWICQKKTADKPGTSDSWRLAVKAGRDAHK